jgi:cytochrome c oxidase subunit 1
MTTISIDDTAPYEEHSHDHAHGNFITRYVFATDHKIIGMQFLMTTLLMLMVGGAFALLIRWQLAYPWAPVPFFGAKLFAAQGGQMTPEFYTMLFTMHGTVMIFLVIIPILAGAFGNFLIPLMIGAGDMAFPRLNMFSYWFMWPAIACFIYSMFHGEGPASGWTAYPALAEVLGEAQTWWLLGLFFVGISSMMGSINYLTTIINMRAPGMTLFRMPMTIWGMLITAVLQAFALPVLTAATIMLICDRVFHTCFFQISGMVVNNGAPSVGGGQSLLWQHLFWFYSHPAVYIMLLPTMGMVSDMLSTMSRKPLFGYKPMIFSMIAIAGLGFIVWGHHMFISGMNPALGMAFMISTIMIALPSAIKTFNWIGTIWGGHLVINTVSLNAVTFVSMFVVGGLSGIFMAAVPVDVQIHDTYFIVAHFHYVLFGASLFGVFGAIHYWYPKMFGRMMNDTMGQVHFALTFITFNATFFPMHMLGVAGMPRRYADPYLHEYLEHLLPLNQFMTWAAIVMGVVQFLLIFNFFGSMFFGKRAGMNPWNANTLEWQAPSPPPHGNFAKTPIVFRGPYEYSSPHDTSRDYLCQTDPPIAGEVHVHV